MSWHKPSRQWRKRLGGKDYYLGTGDGKSDLQGYNLALAKWRQIQAGKADAAATAQMSEIAKGNQAWGAWLMSRPNIDPQVYAAGAAPALAPTEISATLTRKYPLTGKASGAATNSDGGTETIGSRVDAYLKKQGTRVAAGQRSAGHWENLHKNLKDFRAWAGEKKPVSIINGSLLSDYHTLLMERMEQKKASPSHARDRLQSVKQFIRWLWTQELIELPRNIGSPDLEITVNPTTVKFMDPAEFRRLCSGATEQTKVYLLLMANCGMTQKDISDLRQDEVDWTEGRINRKRSKTCKHANVPIVSYKLWTETFDLLKKHRSKAGDLVFKTRRGNPLKVTRLVPIAGKTLPSCIKTDAITNAYWRLTDQLGIKPRTPMKMIRKTGASLLQRKFPALVGLYLGHAPGSVAEVFYVAEQTSRLDRAMDWLRVQFLGEAEDDAAAIQVAEAQPGHSTLQKDEDAAA